MITKEIMNTVNILEFISMFDDGLAQFGAKISGPWFNIKTPYFQYRESHYGDKTILRPSYLHNGISYTGKTASLYWIQALQVEWWSSLAPV